MYKVSELTDIKERTPILLYVRRDEGDSVLHISNRRGLAPNRTFSDGRHIENVTNCNRVLEYSDVFSKGTIGIQGFKTCTRCGSPADFENALENYHEASKRNHEEYQARQQAEREVRRQAFEDLQVATRRFGSDLWDADFKIQLNDDNTILTIERYGYVFSIVADKKIEPANA